MEEVWERFNSEIIKEANVPGQQWLWRLKRKEVIARLKNDLQYDGDFKRKLKLWSKVFKTKGFTVDLILPGDPLGGDFELDGNEDEVDRNRDAKKEAKKFRLIITPNTEKGTSVYSRTSSLTRSVTGEANLQQVASNQPNPDHQRNSDEQDDP